MTAKTDTWRPAGTPEMGTSSDATAKKRTKGKDAASLDPAQSYRSAMRELIAARWGDVWRAVPIALAGEDIEGVHDVRVASRRLRAAMDVAADCFPGSWYRPLHRAAKEITAALGEVRDRDVLLEALGTERKAAAPAERPGVERLIARVERERIVARAEMERFLAGVVERGVPDEAARRFGPAAGALNLADGGAGPDGDVEKGGAR